MKATNDTADRSASGRLLRPAERLRCPLYEIHAQTIEIFEAGPFALRAMKFGPWMNHLGPTRC